MHEPDGQRYALPCVAADNSYFDFLDVVECTSESIIGHGSLLFLIVTHQCPISASFTRKPSATWRKLITCRPNDGKLGQHSRRSGIRRWQNGYSSPGIHPLNFLQGT